MPWPRLPAPPCSTQAPWSPVDATFCLQLVAFGWLAGTVAGWLGRRWPSDRRGDGGGWRDEPPAVALWPASGVRGAGPPPRIRRVTARQILDSRGHPTVEVDVVLTVGAVGRAAVPSGASTGRYEAAELRDGDATRHLGRGVLRSVAAVNETFAPHLIGLDPTDQRDIDRLLCDVDGTPNKGRLGANGVLGVSLAVCRAAALAKGVPLYRHIADLHGTNRFQLPVPMCNIINGGKHADNRIDLQEFMVVPVGAPRFGDAVRWCAEVFHHLRRLLRAAGHTTAVGDEGGFAPDISNEEALEFIVTAIEAAGYAPGSQIGIALDCAASELFTEGGGRGYRLWKSAPARLHSSTELVDQYREWCSRYPIVSLEDPLDQDAWDKYAALTRTLGGDVQLVGDDLFVTNPERLRKGVAAGACTSVLVKPNQVGTVSETLECIQVAQAAGYGVVCSHRSGETEDTFIADLAVGTAAGQIKTGALSRTDRVAKYNQLLRIEEELGPGAAWSPDVLRRAPPRRGAVP
eukprot:EG_transcript_7256